MLIYIYIFTLAFCHIHYTRFNLISFEENVIELECLTRNFVIICCLYMYLCRNYIYLVLYRSVYLSSHCYTFSFCLVVYLCYVVEPSHFLILVSLRAFMKIILLENLHTWKCTLYLVWNRDLWCTEISL